MPFQELAELLGIANPDAYTFHPQGFFCAQCDNLYQQWVIVGPHKKHKVTSRLYQYQANHDNFI
jgi:hypothetical protein